MPQSDANTNTVTMLDPTGTARQVPLAQKAAAIKAGGRVAVKMIDPAGTARWIPEDQREAALKAGGRLTGASPASSPAALSAPTLSSAAIPAVEDHATPVAPGSPEGVYRMAIPQINAQGQIRLGGTVLSVPYSQVESYRKQGYELADQPTIERYGADFAADPKNQGDFTRTVQGHPILGFVPRVFMGFGGSLEEGLAGADRLLAKARGETPIEPLQLEAAKHGGEGLPEAIGATGEQVAELLVGEGEATEAARGTTLAKKAGDLSTKVADLTKFLDKYPRVKALVGLGYKSLATGAKAAAEQGTQQYVRSGGDVEQTKEAMETAGAVGAASPAVAGTVRVLGRFSADVGRHYLWVGNAKTYQLLDKTEELNEKIRERAARVREANAEKLAQYQKDIETAKTDAAKANSTQAEKEAAARAQQEAENKAAKIAHDNALLEQEELAAKRGVLSRTILQLQSRLAQRVQTLQRAAQSYFKRNYAQVEMLVDGIDEKVPPPALEGKNPIKTDAWAEMTPARRKAAWDAYKSEIGVESVGDEPSNRRVGWDELSSAVEDSIGKIEGSRESVKPFKDILDKAAKYSADMDEPPPALKGQKAISARTWAGMNPEEREAAWESVKADWGPEQEGAKFADLKGYYSEAGRLLASPSTPGDVKQALLKFRSSIDDMQQEMANEAGVGARYKLLRNQYRNYAEGFLDYQGPNKSGSPVALALKGEDAFHQTQPLANKNLSAPELSRIKQILAGGSTAETQFIQWSVETPGATGKSEPAWRYRRDTTKLLDNLRKAQSDLDSLPKPKEVPSLEQDTSAIEPKPPVEPKEDKEPKLRKVPQEKTLSPAELQKAKAKALAQRAYSLSHFGTYVASYGLVGAVIGLSTGHDWQEKLTRGAEGLIVGAYTPYILSQILEKPGVIAALSRPTQKDLQTLMKLPPDLRPGVEENLRRLSEEAQKKGLLRAPSPWIRILAGTVARKEATQPAPTETSPASTTPGLMPLSPDQSQPAVMPLGAQ